MSDYEDDPQYKEFKQRVEEGLIPKLRESDCTVSLVPEGKPDVKFSVELGLSIMLDKPIILVIRPGTKVPAKLAIVADEIVEIDDFSSPATQMSIGNAVNRVVKD